jgi:NAD(P)-dependent dehydrogenase (short-subunit alcohol dehydrogenase family)
MDQGDGMCDLTGKVCIVTGSTKGIGLAIAAAMVEAGATVVVNGRSSAEVESVAQELAGLGVGTAIGIACDVRQPDACWSLVEETVDRFGHLDVLVNNAGIGRFAPIQEMSVEDWQAQIETNLGGVFYCSKAAAPHIGEGEGGWIINIASLASRNTFSGGVGYNASKFGLLGMTEAMMLDLRYDNVRVSLIMPGSVSTHFGGRAPTEQDAWRLRPEDIARSVMDLLAYPGNALPSRVELRPTQPPRK